MQNKRHRHLKNCRYQQWMHCIISFFKKQKKIFISLIIIRMKKKHIYKKICRIFLLSKEVNLCEVPNWIFCSFNKSRIVSLILYTLSHDGTIRYKENGPNECSLKHIQVIKKVIKHSKSIYDTSNVTLTSNRHRMSE